MGKQPIDVIIDTDIGDDIDDAAALCAAMQSPELNILGVTTVFKNTVMRAQIARRLLRLGGHGNIPVYAGASRPLKNMEVYGRKADFEEPPITYTEEYADEEIDTEINAKQFIISKLEQCSSPIRFITLGALTNIAEVFSERPDLKEKVESIFIMGGAYSTFHVGEYNFSCDPEAADLVLDSGVKILCAGLDVTFQCRLSDENMKVLYKAKHPCLKMLVSLQRAWGHNIVLHDPLVVLLAADRSFVQTEKMKCKIELNGAYSRGMSVNLSNWTWNLPADASSVEVAMKVDAERVVSTFMERVLKFDEQLASVGYECPLCDKPDR